MKRIAALLVCTTVLVCLVIGAAVAGGWGTGTVSTWQSDNATTIEYSISGDSYGSGTSGLYCEVYTPSGVWVNPSNNTRNSPSNNTGTAWHNGQSFTYWNYYGYNGEHGWYYAYCYWLVGTSEVASSGSWFYR